MKFFTEHVGKEKARSCAGGGGTFQERRSLLWRWSAWGEDFLSVSVAAFLSPYLWFALFHIQIQMPSPGGLLILVVFLLLWQAMFCEITQSVVIPGNLWEVDETQKWRAQALGNIFNNPSLHNKKGDQFRILSIAHRQRQHWENARMEWVRKCLLTSAPHRSSFCALMILLLRTSGPELRTTTGIGPRVVQSDDKKKMHKTS